MNCSTKCFYYCCLGWLEYASPGGDGGVSVVQCIPGQDCTSHFKISCNSEKSVFVICGKQIYYTHLFVTTFVYCRSSILYVAHFGKMCLNVGIIFFDLLIKA